MREMSAASSGRRRRAGGVRATPYSTSSRKKTAAPASVDFLRSFTPTSHQLEFMKVIVDKTWQLYHVSPLWHFTTTAFAITQHTQQLTTILSQASKIPSGLKTTVKVIKGIGLDGSDGLRISSTKKVSNKDVTVLEAFLCRLGHVDRVQHGFMSLPLLLCRGPQSLTTELHLWLQTSFDCHVTPHGLESDDLCLLLGQFSTAEKSSGRGVGGVELVYKTPPTINKEGLSRVSVSLPYSSVISLWDKAGNTDTERRTGFVELLQRHIKKILGFKLEAMSLLRISTPVLHAEATGRVKFTTEDHIIQVLSVLQSRHF